jgi:hypothetical protein
MLNELPGALRSLRHSRRLTSQAPQCRPHLKGEIRSATAYRSQKTPGNHRFPVEVYDLPLSLIRDQREAVGPPRIHRYIIFIQDLLLSGLKLLTFFDCFLPNISDRDGGGGGLFPAIDAIRHSMPKHVSGRHRQGLPHSRSWYARRGRGAIGAAPARTITAKVTVIRRTG